MDTNAWVQLACTYGPLVIIVPLLLKVHWDLVYKVLPRSLRALEKSARQDRRVLRRAVEAMNDVVEMCSHCAQNKRRRESPRRRAYRAVKKSK